MVERGEAASESTGPQRIIMMEVVQRPAPPPPPPPPPAPSAATALAAARANPAAGSFRIDRQTFEATLLAIFPPARGWSREQIDKAYRDAPRRRPPAPQPAPAPPAPPAPRSGEITRLPIPDPPTAADILEHEAETTFQDPNDGPVDTSDDESVLSNPPPPPAEEEEQKEEPLAPLRWKIGTIRHDAPLRLAGLPRNRAQGVNRRRIRYRDTPEYIFGQLFPDKLYITMARETNRYHDQRVAAGKDQEEAEETAKKRGKPYKGGSRRWKPVTAGEMKRFIGLLLAISLLPKQGIKQIFGERKLRRKKIAKYLSNRAGGPPRRVGSVLEDLVKPLTKYMSLKRFQQIWRYFHLINNEDPAVDKTDKVRHVQPVLKEIKKTFKECYYPGQHLAFDEAMIPWKGKWCKIRQYMPKKPIKYGIKIFAICDSVTNYCYAFEIYKGKEGTHPWETIETQQNINPTQLDKMIIYMMDQLMASGHILYADRFFTSPKLAIALAMRHKIEGKHSHGFTGSGQRNRIGWPDETILPKVDKEGKGTIRNAKQSASEEEEKHDDEAVHPGDLDRPLRLVASTMNDAGVVHCLSTCQGNAEEETEVMGDAGLEMTVKPHCLIEYIKYMGGVDDFDHMRQTTNIAGRIRVRKWWKRLFLGLLDFAVTNAWIIYRENVKEVPPREGEIVMEHSEFVDMLAYGLIYNSTLEEETMKAAEEEEEEEHAVRRVSKGDRRSCVVCLSRDEADRSRKEVKSYTFCETCDHWCHEGECWETMHANQESIAHYAGAKLGPRYHRPSQRKKRKR